MFTYVSGDSFCDEFERNYQVTTSSHETSTASLKSSMMRRKKVGTVFF